MSTTPTADTPTLLELADRESSHITLRDGRVAVINSIGEVGLQVRNSEFAAFVSMTAAEAGAVARLLLRASTRIEYPKVAEQIDAGDAEGAAQLS